MNSFWNGITDWKDGMLFYFYPEFLSKKLLTSYKNISGLFEFLNPLPSIT